MMNFICKLYLCSYTTLKDCTTDGMVTYGAIHSDAHRLGDCVNDIININSWNAKLHQVACQSASLICKNTLAILHMINSTLLLFITLITLSQFRLSTNIPHMKHANLLRKVIDAMF